MRCNNQRGHTHRQSTVRSRLFHYDSDDILRDGRTYLFHWFTPPTPSTLYSVKNRMRNRQSLDTLIKRSFLVSVFVQVFATSSFYSQIAYTRKQQEVYNSINNIWPVHHSPDSLVDQIAIYTVPCPQNRFRHRTSKSRFLTSTKISRFWVSSCLLKRSSQ